MILLFKFGLAAKLITLSRGALKNSSQNLIQKKKDTK
jgi:hypothetical protein